MPSLPVVNLAIIVTQPIGYTDAPPKLLKQGISLHPGAGWSSSLHTAKEPSLPIGYCIYLSRDVLHHLEKL